METTVVRVENLSKHFTIRREKSLKERIVNFGRSQAHKEEFWALRDINLEIPAGQTIGLIGPNGSGKSTLLKMIGGILQPDTGSVSVRGRLAALLELGAGFHPDLTGRENVFLNASILGLSRAETERNFDEIVEFSGIEKFIDTQVKFYSSGMYVRLAFAVAVHVDPDILLVDEVLAVGDEPFQKKCLDRIKQFQDDGRTIVLVTHSLNTVADFCDRAVVLDKGRITEDSDPRQSLQALRSDYEDARLAEQERIRTNAGLPPEPEARFTGISVSSHDGGPSTIESGGGIAVAMEVTADKPLEGCNIELGITSALGETLFATTTAILGHNIPRLSQVNHMAMHIWGLYLVPDIYNVRVTLRDKEGQELHHVPVASSFEITGSTQSIGWLNATAQFISGS